MFLEMVPPDQLDAALYRTRWLKLQIQPSLLNGKLDVFQELTGRLINEFTTQTSAVGHISSVLLDRFNDIVPKCRIMLPTGIRGPTDSLHLVIDEVQYAASQHLDAFRSEPRADKKATKDAVPPPETQKSDSDEEEKIPASQRRPILREILKAWVHEYPVTMIVAGTGVDKEALDETMNSAVGKTEPYGLTHNTGLFGGKEEVADSDSLQDWYIRRFLPPDLQVDPKYVCLIDRTKYWLKGRFRFTAGFISELLAAGYENPHETLNEYIFKFSLPPKSTGRATAATQQQYEKIGMVVTDCPPQFMNDDPSLRKKIRKTLSERITFDFERLKSQPDHLIDIANMTTDYWVTPHADLNVSHWGQDFVQWGFARFLPDTNAHNISSARIDEPLVMLTLAQWLSRPGFLRSMHAALVSDIGKLNDTHGYNGFERYIAFCFSGLFSDTSGSRLLKDIFNFKSDLPQWANKKATLVSCWKPDETSEKWEEATVDWNARPSHHLASSNNVDDTLDWLEGKSRAPICFPDKFMGPDLLMRLRIEDGTRIWVAVQCKYESSDQLKAGKLIAGAKSLDPEQYFKSNPVYHTRALDALKVLPNPVMAEGLGYYNILQVIASFPGDPSIDEARRGKTRRSVSNEMTSLNMDYLAEITGRMRPYAFLRDKLKTHMLKRLHSQVEGAEAVGVIIRSSKRIRVNKDVKEVAADSDVEMAPPASQASDAMQDVEA
ncbi:hypothetical protein R3P38DRAFT_2881754 [Favolaschia claudopus]|uniref:Uncharacterized protein n=1 Tax=Favolaschia claudopus TaxID=2862362 RepID=A0AAW0D2T3_9AGAR